MAHEGYISKALLSTTVCWGVVVVMLTTAWVLAVIVPEAWLFVGLLAATACVFAAIAAVLHARMQMLRLAKLIRLANGLESADAELHSIR